MVSGHNVCGWLAVWCRIIFLIAYLTVDIKQRPDVTVVELLRRERPERVVSFLLVVELKREGFWRGTCGML